LALRCAVSSRIAAFSALNRTFSSANEKGTPLKTKQPVRFQGFFEVAIEIAGK